MTDACEAEALWRKLVREIPDFPVAGIGFKDITPVLAHPGAFRACADALAERFAGAGVEAVAAAEARGFIFGIPVAERLGVGFAAVRKPGKLPAATVGVTYELEYGSDSLEMHLDSFAPGARVLVVDDVLATGGTARATCDLVEEAGGQVAGCAFFVELAFLHGRFRLEGRRVESLVVYS
ncbi:MAG: adenine phosphoribosyltransferase [bacterium]|nr:adenine phosphoribosyltransferase [bacterium]